MNTLSTCSSPNLGLKTHESSFSCSRLLLYATMLLSFRVAGWSTRWVMINLPDFDIYKINQCFLIISPVLLAIVEYITMSKLLALSAANQAGTTGDARKTPVGVLSRYVAWAFTASDVVCCLLQGSGGALYSDPQKADLARLLLLIGLFAQLAFFSVFIALMVYVHFSPRFGFRAGGSLQKLRPVFVGLYAITLLLHLRNIFRVVEFVQGFAGDLARNENMLYIFDFGPVYACFLLFTFMHPGVWLGPRAAATQASIEPLPVLTVSTKQHSVGTGALSKQNSIVHVHCA